MKRTNDKFLQATKQYIEKYISTLDIYASADDYYDNEAGLSDKFLNYFLEWLERELAAEQVLAKRQ